MDKRILIAVGVIALIVLIVLLYPKECGKWSTAAGGTYRDCGCIGVMNLLNPQAPGGGTNYCYGICNNCHCYKHESNPNPPPGFKRVEVPCE